MHYLSQILFLVALGVFIFLIRKRIISIKKTILLGKPADRKGHTNQRFKNMLLVAFGQQKMFKKIIPAFFHFIIYAGFLLINLEVLEFIIDGLFGTHRVLSNILGAAYPVMISSFELLALLVMLSCIIFLIRRNILKIDRFSGIEMKRWPKLDANLILIIEVVFMKAILVMNAADQLLETGHYAMSAPGDYFFSTRLFVPIFEGYSENTLILLERGAWWFHILGIFAFSIYVTYSKHLHIALAFPNTWFSNLNAKGKIESMPVVTKEVKGMLGIPLSPEDSAIEDNSTEKFGAKDINDLSWVNLMNAYACTECGRCTAQCPANQTGKLLSPRKIMMDTRDRCEEVAFAMEKGEDGLVNGKTLLNDFITKEEINACTSCNACVEACPVQIDPLSIILQLRRFVAMEESGSPASWNSMFSNIETSMAPWKFAAADRFNWKEELLEEEEKKK